jgi:hypothetical protein
MHRSCCEKPERREVGRVFLSNGWYLCSLQGEVVAEELSVRIQDEELPPLLAEVLLLGELQQVLAEVLLLEVLSERRACGNLQCLPVAQRAAVRFVTLNL